jgi:hypothetical protein
MGLFDFLKGKSKVLPEIDDVPKEAALGAFPRAIEEFTKASSQSNKASEEYFAETERLADQVVYMADAWMKNPLAWVLPIDEDREFWRLEEARDEVKRRKYSLLNTLSEEDRWGLTRRHPMWIEEYDLFIGGIVRAEACNTFPGDHVGLECQLAPIYEKPLKTFFLTGGLILKVNTLAAHYLHKTHAVDPSIWEVLKFREFQAQEIQMSGEFTRRDLGRDKEHQWLFVGTRWDYSGSFLKLDFGRHSQEIDYFVAIMKDQREKNLGPHF